MRRKPKVQFKNWFRSLLIVPCGLLILLVASSSLLVAHSEPNPGLPTPQTYLTEFLANSVTPPLRDDYALYAALKTHNPSDKNLPHTQSRPGFKVGDKDKFWVFNLQTKQYHQVTASCVAVTPHLYMFLDDAFRQDVPSLVQVAQAFEDKIYPTDRQYFGSEWTPGVDEDPHLTILNTPLQLASGYFSASDEILQPVNPHSNEREMFYINVPPTTGASSFYLATLAHEFQHMIEYHTRYNQFAWINEASSVLAQVYNGYGSGGLENAFMSTPDTQLGAWTCGGCGTGRYYGVGYTWVSYFSERFGPDLIKNLTAGGPGVTGLNSVDSALAQTAHPALDTQSVFSDWVVANLLNHQTADPKYNYQKINTHIQPKSVATLPTQLDGSTHQYTASYYAIDNPAGSFDLNFIGQTTVGLTGTQPHSGQMAWWSNRGDNSDSTLSHDFDLSATTNTTLKFWTWFDTEANYDYLYIEASSDDGATWDILPGKYTSDVSHTGQSFGPGLTGRSQPDKTDLSDGDENTAQWVQEQIDLTRYAGKKIKVRFQYLTDDAYNKQGALLDDVEIPQIGFKDDMEGGENGWQAAGWTRNNNQLPQHFVVRVVSRDGVCGQANITDLNAANCIQDLPLDTANTGHQRFAFHQAIVIVAPYATKTLLPTSFKLNLGV